MVRPSIIAVLRSNAQILELMAAQYEELARRTIDTEEITGLQTLARKCRILAGDMSQAVQSAAA